MIRRGIRPNNDRVGTRTRVSRQTDASPGPPLNSRTNRRKLARLYRYALDTGRALRCCDEATGGEKAARTAGKAAEEGPESIRLGNANGRQSETDAVLDLHRSYPTDVGPALHPELRPWVSYPEPHRAAIVAEIRIAGPLPTAHEAFATFPAMVARCHLVLGDAIPARQMNESVRFCLKNFKRRHYLPLHEAANLKGVGGGPKPPARRLSGSRGAFVRQRSYFRPASAAASRRFQAANRGEPGLLQRPR